MYDEAESDLNMAIKLDKNNCFAFCMRGLLYVETGYIHLAIEDFTRAIYIKPDYAKAYYERGEIYRSLYQFDKAREDFRKGCELGHLDSCFSLRWLKNDIEHYNKYNNSK